MSQSAGDWDERVWLNWASVQGDVTPIHQRDPPSWSRMERIASFDASSPRMGLECSTSSGPAWRSSLEVETAENFDLREMEGSFEEESIR